MSEQWVLKGSLGDFCFIDLLVTLNVHYSLVTEPTR